MSETIDGETELVSKQENEISNDGPKTEGIEEKSFFKKFWIWLTESKQRLFSIIFLLAFIVFMIYLGVANIDPTREMLEIVFWFQEKTGNIGLYIGVGIISIFGNFVMFIPVLYAAVLMFVAMMDVNVFILGIAAGIGASIGQIFSWFVGRATREIASNKLEKQLRKTQRWVERGLAPLMIFIFAATPLPDEVLLIMIGLIGYSLGKTLIYCFIGKIVLTLSVSLLAQTFSATAFGNWLLSSLFGLTREMLLNQELPTENNIWTSIAVWIITASLVVLVTFVDWVELYDKHICKIEQRRIRNILSIAIDNEKEKLDFEENNFENKFLKLNFEEKEEKMKEIFPDKALWFLEEKISEKKNTYLRRSLLDVLLFSEKSFIVILKDVWLEGFRKNLINSEFNKMKNEKMSLIKIPNTKLESGFVPTESKLISFKTKIKYLLSSENSEHLIENTTLSQKEKRELLRTKISVEFLIETMPNNEAQIHAIGLKEGTYLNKITDFDKFILFYYWLNLLSILNENPELVEELLIYNLRLTEEVRDEIDIPEDILTSCPV